MSDPSGANLGGKVGNVLFFGFVFLFYAFPPKKLRYFLQVDRLTFYFFWKLVYMSKLDKFTTI